MTYIKHFNVKGSHWGQHKYGDWDKRATYANGQDDPNAKKRKKAESKINKKINKMAIMARQSDERLADYYINEYDRIKNAHTTWEKMNLAARNQKIVEKQIKESEKYKKLVDKASKDIEKYLNDYAEKGIDKLEKENTSVEKLINKFNELSMKDVHENANENANENTNEKSSKEPNTHEYEMVMKLMSEDPEFEKKCESQIQSGQNIEMLRYIDASKQIHTPPPEDITEKDAKGDDVNQIVNHYTNIFINACNEAYSYKEYPNDNERRQLRNIQRKAAYEQFKALRRMYYARMNVKPGDSQKAWMEAYYKAIEDLNGWQLLD